MQNDDIERFRERLRATGASVPEELIPIVATFAAPLLRALDEIAARDFGAVEPFSPNRLADPPRRGGEAVPDDLTSCSVAELRRLLATREASAVEVTEAHLRRIETLDTRVHAFVTVTADDARSAARAADKALAHDRAGVL